MPEDPTISAYQSSLRQYREARDEGQARIKRLEAELNLLRAQDVRLARLIDETEFALRQALFPGEAPLHHPPVQPPPPPQYDMEISAPPRQTPAQSPQYRQQAYQPPYSARQEERYPASAWQTGQTGHQQSGHQSPQYSDPDDDYQNSRIEEQVAQARRKEQKSNVRFNDFRIPQAATIVLREAGRPLHVNEIYRRMAEGGFEFRGQHQLITLAVSLSRSKRFRKVEPGTFELSPEYLAGQVA